MIVNLEQGTPEWHAWRAEGIGSSDVAAIMGVSPWCSREQLLEEKLRGYTVADNWATRRGKAKEPQIVRHMSRVLGAHFVPVCFESDYSAWMRASLDGYDDANPESHGMEMCQRHRRRRAIEVKAPDWKTHELNLYGHVPAYYHVQVQWQMLVAELEEVTFVTWNDSKKFSESRHYAWTVVPADQALMNRIYEAASRFRAELLAAR